MIRSKKWTIRFFAHFRWATWAICSRSQFFSKGMSKLLRSLTKNERRSCFWQQTSNLLRNPMSKFPTLLEFGFPPPPREFCKVIFSQSLKKVILLYTVSSTVDELVVSARVPPLPWSYKTSNMHNIQYFTIVQYKQYFQTYNLQFQNSRKTRATSKMQIVVLRCDLKHSFRHSFFLLIF